MNSQFETAILFSTLSAALVSSLASVPADNLAVGLVRDEQEQFKSRSALWTEFNTCWLSTLQRQKQLVDEQNSTGQLEQPLETMREEQLMKMGRELVRLCDSMERHGLVDYQMGVWEEEILEGE